MAHDPLELSELSLNDLFKAWLTGDTAYDVTPHVNLHEFSEDIDEDNPLPINQVNVAGTFTDTADVAVDNTATGVVLLAANTERKGFTVQNTGQAPIRVRVGGDPTATRGFQLQAGQMLNISVPNCPTGAVKAIREGGTNSTAYPVEIT